MKRRQNGFTLLELAVAFALLAFFILPVLHIVHEARIRAVNYSRKREVQDLAQKKLFERIYFYSEQVVNAGELQAMSGDFAEEGHPDWEWCMVYPEIVSQGEQILLEYRIRVFVPEMGDETLGSGGGMGMGGFTAGGLDSGSFAMGEMSQGLYSYGWDECGDRTANYEMTTWALPSEFWYAEQEELMARGVDTGYLGGYGGGYGGGPGDY